MEVPKWFREEWISGDLKAIGIYKALLFTRFGVSLNIHEVRYPVREEILSSLKKRGITEEIAIRVWRSADEFIDSIFSEATVNPYGSIVKHEDGERIRSILEEIESKYYERFREACHEYFRKDEIDDLSELEKDYLYNVLKYLQYPRSGERTKAGSVRHYNLITPGVVYHLATGKRLVDLKEEEKEKEVARVEKVIRSMISSGILWFGEIVPAPFLENDFIRDVILS